MSLVLFLSWSATIATVGFFLSGLLTCQKMIQSGSAENVPLLPFVTTFLNFKTPLHHNLPLKTMKCPRVDHNVTVPERLCSFAMSCMVWASYGVFKGDDALVPVNVIGMITQVLFTLCFFLYCKERGKEIKTVVYAAVVAFSLYVYIDHFLSNDQTRVRHLGLICIVLTITMQASPLATVAKVVQTRSTESMPFIFSFMMVLVSFLWLSYGTVVEDVNIQVPNATGVFLGLLQLSLFCIYPSKPSVNTKL